MARFGKSFLLIHEDDLNLIMCIYIYIRGTRNDFFFNAGCFTGLAQVGVAHGAESVGRISLMLKGKKKIQFSIPFLLCRLMFVTSL